MPILIALWKFKYWIAIAVFFVLWVVQIAYSNNLAGKLKQAEAKCNERVDKLEKQYRDAAEQQQESAFKVSEDYETGKAERQTQTEYVIKEVEKVIYRDVYRNDCSDDAGRSLLNEEIHHTNSSGKS